MALVGDLISALLGVSTFERGTDPLKDEEELLRARAFAGGALAQRSRTETRWYLADLETAIIRADSGDLRQAAKAWKAMRGDGMLSGLLSTCTKGLVRLPKRFYGAEDQVAELVANNGSTSVFDAMYPAAELARIAADGIGLGAGIGELLPVRGRDYPVLVALDPEWLSYDWTDGRWIYQSATGPLNVTPGDGHWVLHLPGGRIAPWREGQWYPLGQAWVPKTHAKMYRSAWESKLANPARVAVSPSGASESAAQSWFQSVMAWGVNTVFGMRPGYDVKLIESNGRGYESFTKTIADSNLEFMICLAGQTVTTDGGTGFANADIHRTIRSDIIKAIADALAHTLNTQCLPSWTIARWGVEALSCRAVVEWDVTPPKDRAQEANAQLGTANAIKGLREALAPYGRDVDVVEITQRAGVPTVCIAPLTEPTAQGQTVDPDGDGEPGEPPAPDAAQQLAEKMTAEGVTRCEHGAVNRCRLCGIERDRDFERDESGEVVWKVKWKPIGAPSAPAETTTEEAAA